MMHELVNLVVQDERWRETDIAQISDTAACTVLDHHDLSKSGWSIDVLACDDAKISDLNQEFRGKATPTNVLSWPSFQVTPKTVAQIPKPSGFDDTLGDIAIAFETCQAEATLAKIPLSDHILHLLIHGCLHLLGYDHETEQDAAVMEGLETRLLAKLGVNDPYRTTA